MIRLRLAACVAGVGALVTCAPSLAWVLPEPSSERAQAGPAATGMPLLVAAARSARTRAWSATQRVVTAVGAASLVSTQVQVEHVPGRGSVVRDAAGTATVAADVLDDSLLVLLAEHYHVRAAGDAVCAGRTAQLVEVVRPGVVGAGAVAARFWVDSATGLLLRRDILDEDGAVRRSVEVMRLAIPPAVTVLATAAEPPGEVLRPRGQHLEAAALALLAAQGWPIPASLPRGFDLYEARLLQGDVLQLAYSDGLSVSSVFIQRGALPADTTGVRRTLAGASVWEPDGAPGRLVWSSEGLTFTLVSDASPDARDAAVLALPHTGDAVVEDGMAPRVWRGLDRVGSWLNPFD